MLVTGVSHNHRAAWNKLKLKVYLANPVSRVQTLIGISTLPIATPRGFCGHPLWTLVLHGVHNDVAHAFSGRVAPQHSRNALHMDNMLLTFSKRSSTDLFLWIPCDFTEFSFMLFVFRIYLGMLPTTYWGTGIICMQIFNQHQCGPSGTNHNSRCTGTIGLVFEIGTAVRFVTAISLIHPFCTYSKPH